MGTSLHSAAIPRVSLTEGPETRRQSTMARTLQRIGRIALLVAVLGALTATPVLPGARAWAKPYPQDPGPPPTSGDPTGDDLPNPTPKPINRASAFTGRGHTATRGGIVVIRAFGEWKWVLRYVSLSSLR